MILWFTVPNLLSMLRMVLIIPIVFFILRVNDTNFVFLLSLYSFAIFLDFLDGFFARRFGQVTDLGKILDPLADKVLVLVVLLILTLRHEFPLLLAVIIILRDCLILLASVLLFRGKHVIKPSIFVGKVTFGLLSVLIFIYILDFHSRLDLIMIKQFFIVLSFTFVIWSWIEYLQVYIRETHERKQINSGR